MILTIFNPHLTFPIALNLTLSLVFMSVLYFTLPFFSCLTTYLLCCIFCFVFNLKPCLTTPFPLPSVICFFFCLIVYPLSLVIPLVSLPTWSTELAPTSVLNWATRFPTDCSRGSLFSYIEWQFSTCQLSCFSWLVFFLAFCFSSCLELCIFILLSLYHYLLRCWPFICLNFCSYCFFSILRRYRLTPRYFSSLTYLKNKSVFYINFCFFTSLISSFISHLSSLFFYISNLFQLSLFNSSCCAFIWSLL